MAILSGVTVNWSVSPRIINIPIAYTDITVEDLNDTLQDIEDNEEGIVFQRLRDASGKETLSATELVALTIKLINAKVKFADRGSATVCSISGGNLVAVDANNSPMNPIQYATYVTVAYAKSSSATIVETTTSGLTAEESAKLTAIADDTVFLKAVEGGKWNIAGGQMIFYGADNTTEIMRFNITYDADNNPITRTRV